MALNFPATPTLNQTYSFGAYTWQWDGNSWVGAVPIVNATINNTTIGATTPSTAVFTTLATTGDVSVGGNLSVTGGIRKSLRLLTTTTTLTIADAGGLVEYTSSGGAYTVTLPDPTLATSLGIGYRFWQNTANNITLSTPVGAFYGPSGSTTSTKVLAQATTQYWDVWCDGYNWLVFGIKIA
jgi:hypothetical protein